MPLYVNSKNYNALGGEGSNNTPPYIPPAFEGIYTDNQQGVIDNIFQSSGGGLGGAINDLFSIDETVDKYALNVAGFIIGTLFVLIAVYAMVMKDFNPIGKLMSNVNKRK